MQTVLPQPNDGAAHRMGALASLPLFFPLTGRRVLVAGGGEAAAWKAELLAAAGADVHVFAPAEERSESLLALAENGAAAGQVRLHDRSWQEGNFTGIALAVGEVEDDEAAAFAASARAAGVPVNVIDKPEFCDFQFGSIVNRSPVVIGISTNGAAPIIGQAVRRRIETLLPQALAQWGELARKMRDAVMAKLKPGPERRAFWERFADKAFSGQMPGMGAEGDAARLMHAVAARGTAGRVTLVGAGPGDAELLTLKAVRALQSADVILFDDLVSSDVLELARREAKRMLVGKRGGKRSCRQEDINDMMMGLARRGKHVVRLKSGDPMVFGRAGEEISMLEEHGIPVEIVPGVTAAMAMAARLGISLTHRDHAQAVRFVTGHSRAGRVPETLDFGALAEPGTTTVYYMSRRTGAQIARRLLAEGMPGSTPALIASDVSRPEEAFWHGTLAEVGLAAADLPTHAVSMLAIGDALGAGMAGLRRAAEPLRQGR